MNATKKLHDVGQSLWLDNITRGLLSSGTLHKYIDEWSVTGLTSNPSIFNQAIGKSKDYDDDIRAALKAGKSDEDLFFDLAQDDLAKAADLFRPIHDRTDGVDGFVSLEVSPLLAYDTANTIAAAKRLHAQANKPNLYIKIPGTREGLPAIEESIFSGIPVNVTLLFSREHYLAAAEAYLRGVERRIDAGLNPYVPSVASLFISRWDAAVASKVPAELKNTLGIAIGQRAYKAYCDLQKDPRWLRAFNNGARAQRLLWASTGTKDPNAPDTLYVKAFASPYTVNTMPEPTLKAFADHGEVGEIMSPDGGNCEETLANLAKAGIDVTALAAQLQKEGAESFVKSWNELMGVIAGKGEALKKVG
jgi:transaldolase